MIAFWVTAVTVSVAAAAVLSEYMHMVLALLAGAGIGFAAGVVVGVAVWVWPIVRVLWHWLPEIIVAVGVPYGLMWLATLMPPSVAVLSVAAVAIGVGAIPATRRHMLALAWCVISRHRLRVCFSAFLAGNRDGSLPLILWAKPTPVGERVYIWLRPGLSLSMLQDRVEQIAVTCWGKEVTVQPGSVKYAGYLRFDIKRRDTLQGVVDSPLAADIPADTPARETPVQVASDPAGLDLPGVPATAVTTSEPAKTSKPARKPAKEPALVGAADDTDDVSNWI